MARTFEAMFFDAIVSQTHTNTVTVTNHPVEDGADIADHLRSQPDELSVAVIVSNNPILVLASIRAQPISGFGDPSSRAEDAHEFIRNLMRDKELVNFSTTLRDYQNMAITSMTVDRDATTGNMVQLNLSLREIIIATTENVDLPEPVAATRNASSNLGKKTKPPTAPPVATKARSILSRITGFGA